MRLPVIRHALAPLVPAAAASLSLPRTLPELASAREGAEARGARGAGDAAGGPATEPARASRDAVAITFDDGPHPEGTPAILEVLARHRALATFFVITEQVQRRPELVRETVAAGHRIALHGHVHRLQLRRSPRALVDDVNRGVSVIGELLGQPPALHRAPFGIYSPAGLAAVRASRLQPVLWSRWGRDWRRHITPEGIARRVAARELAHGEVILLHDADFYSARNSHRRTAQALDLILTELERRGVGTVLPV